MVRGSPTWRHPQHAHDTGDENEGGDDQHHLDTSNCRYSAGSGLCAYAHRLLVDSAYPWAMQPPLQAEADVRWRDWRAGAADSDRRTSKWMTGVLLALILGVSLWLVAAVLAI